MIGSYVGLAQFALHRYRQAAHQWLVSLNLGISVGNVRGMAGSIEGCGYLACQAGEWRTAARLLAAARVTRERTRLPLFNFWCPHLDATMRDLRSSQHSCGSHRRSDRQPLHRNVCNRRLPGVPCGRTRIRPEHGSCEHHRDLYCDAGDAAGAWSSTRRRRSIPETPTGFLRQCRSELEVTLQVALKTAGACSITAASAGCLTLRSREIAKN